MLLTNFNDEAAMLVIAKDLSFNDDSHVVYLSQPSGTVRRTARRGLRNCPRNGIWRRGIKLPFMSLKVRRVASRFASRRSRAAISGPGLMLHGGAWSDVRHFGIALAGRWSLRDGVSPLFSLRLHTESLLFTTRLARFGHPGRCHETSNTRRFLSILRIGGTRSLDTSWISIIATQTTRGCDERKTHTIIPRANPRKKE
ncbi:hypothetical protein PGT21_012961 [Puccinia graminis f. sp. tritici]|nr:hypothetical protein PGT21_012961 [Puccinia graminis f. sp. tritici]